MDFFPGFRRIRIATSGAEINGVVGGSGPPVLLLQGWPQTHLEWRHVAPVLAQRFTVVATDLRGYGDSSKPPEGENHAGYSKRTMAQDQVEVMRQLGFEQFAVVGHDRGGRVACVRIVPDRSGRPVRFAGGRVGTDPLIQPATAVAAEWQLLDIFGAMRAGLTRSHARTLTADGGDVLQHRTGNRGDAEPAASRSIRPDAAG